MSSNREFDLEWGYLAPARPDIHRTTRIALVSAAVGATASAAVVLSLVDRPVAEEPSVAVHTLAPAEPAATPARAPSQRVQLQVPAQATGPEAKQAAATAPATPIPANAAPSAAPSEPTASSTVQQPSNMAAVTEAPAVTDAPPAIEPAHDPAPLPKKRVKRLLTYPRWEELRQPPAFRW